jgi:predicted enzyme related to lactoylglutathione lyase
MPERTSYEPGTPCWVDLSTPDMEGAKRFYGGLFGWEAEEAGPVEETGGYCFFVLRGHSVAGLGPIMGEGQPPAWTTYFAADDADGVAERARTAGAQPMMDPMDVMQAGRMVVLAHPAAGFLGAWQPGNFSGAELVNEPGTVTWNELLTRDVDGAKRFLEAVFGVSFEEQAMGDMTYTVIKVGENSVAGMMPMPPEAPDDVPAYWQTYFAVEDCDGAVARTQELGRIADDARDGRAGGRAVRGGHRSVRCAVHRDRERSRRELRSAPGGDAVAADGVLHRYAEVRDPRPSRLDFGGIVAAEDVVVLLALRIGADHREVLIGVGAPMPGAGGQDDHVAGLDLERPPLRAAELDRGVAADHGEHLVRRRVEVVEVEDPVDPRAAPAAGREELLGLRGARHRGGDVPIEEHREARVVRNAVAGRRVPGLQVHVQCNTRTVDRPSPERMLGSMTGDDIGLIGPDEIAYRLELTPAELKVTYNALSSMLNDFGHDEHDVHQILRGILSKLPPRESIDSIDLRLPRGRPRL